MTLDELKTQLENEIAEIGQAKAGLDETLMKKAEALTVVESTIAAATATVEPETQEGAQEPVEPESGE